MAGTKLPTDPFAAVREATLAHRAEHGCGAYPYDNGALLGTLAAAANARRVLELGTALGYTALWFAKGAPQAVIDSIERDGDHVRLAREQVEAHGMSGHVMVHEGEFAAVMHTLDPGYDVAFFDGGQTHVELLEATSPDSAIAKFIAKRGPGIHHLCLSVTGLPELLQRLDAAGVQLIDKVPRPGANNKRVAFVHPKATGGVLLELSEELPA